MIPDLTGALNGAWRASIRQAGIYLRPPVGVIHLSHDDNADTGGVYLVFGADQPLPTLVLKTSAHAAGQRRLMNAFQALDDLWKISALQGTVPHPIGLFDLGEHCVLVTTALPGTTIEVLMRRGDRVRLDQVQYDLFRAQVWLQLMQEATASGVTAFAGGAAIRERLALLSHLGVALDRRLDAFVAGLEDAAEAHRGMVLPLTGRHGDFRPGHVLLDSSRLGVLDWRDYVTGVTPFDDVFQFAVAAARLYPGPDRRPLEAADAFSRAFLARTRLSELMREYVDRYLRAMHVPTTAAHVLFSQFLLDKVIAEAGRPSGRETSSSRWLPLLVLYGEHACSSVFVPDGGAAPARPPARWVA